MCDIELALESLSRGEVIIVVDDEDRENEGDLIVAAEHATPEMINFMITHARGLVCVAITPDRARELHLPSMVTHNEDHHGTAFTVSVDGSLNTVSPRGSLPMIEPDRSDSSCAERRQTSDDRVTSSPSSHDRAEFSSDRVIRKPQLTWRASPD